MTDRLTGRDYRALRRLVDGDNRTLAEVGDTCENVPAAVLPALLASGKIERERRVSPSATVTPNRRKARR
jgi:hypothetical protein